jgi:hypothetical protein
MSELSLLTTQFSMLDNMQSVAVAVKIGHGLGNTK